jgi:hypothetical protein
VVADFAHVGFGWAGLPFGDQGYVKSHGRGSVVGDWRDLWPWHDRYRPPAIRTALRPTSTSAGEGAAAPDAAPDP